MRSFLNIAPSDKGAVGGGGNPEDDPRFPGRILRTQGFLTLAYGFALGVALMALLALVNLFNLTGPIANVLSDQPLTLASYGRLFLVGLIAGTLIAGVYNLLVVKRINLFGLESTLD